MSDNGQASPSGGDLNVGIVQIETIKQLDEVVVEYTAQRILLHTALESIDTILSDNPTLTDEQRAQSFKVYESRLEQAAAARVQAIARGEHLRPEPTGSVDPAPEDGVREPNPDGETRPTAEATTQPNPNYLFALQPSSGQQGSSLKRIGEEEGTERGEYAWNWDKPGGGRPLEKCRCGFLIHFRQNSPPP